MLGNAQLQAESHERRIGEYARYLKVPSIQDYPELRPVLEEGLKAPLPSGWRVVLNDYGTTMYFHDVSGACGMDHPMDEVYKDKCLEIVSMLQKLRAEEEEQRKLRGVNGHVHAVGAEFDAVGGSQQQNTTRGDSDWSLLEEEFGPAAPAVTSTQQQRQDRAATIQQENQQLVQYWQRVSEQRNEDGVDRDDDGTFELDFPDDCPTTSTHHSANKRVQHAGNEAAHRGEHLPIQQLNTVPQRPQHHADEKIPSSVTARGIAQRMTNTVNREELLEVQRQVETMKALNEAMKKDLEDTKEQLVRGQSECPDEFICPITGEVMTDPVVTADGFTYERKAIKKWLKRHDRSPCTNQELEHKQLIPNLALKSQISTLLERQASTTSIGN